MFFCLRVDLDYVPWDEPDAKEFGHGEPAMVLKLLQMARAQGYKLHFFASGRVVRALPAEIEAVLSDGHDLDWLCKHPADFARRFERAQQLFAGKSNPIKGIALRNPWPKELAAPTDLSGIEFFSAPEGFAPELPASIRHFRADLLPDRDAVRAGYSIRSWKDKMREDIRQSAARNKLVTAVVRPQVLAKIDSNLQVTQEICSLALAVGLPQRTLREAASDAL